MTGPRNVRKYVVMAEVFDQLARSLGPSKDGGDQRVANICRVGVRSVKDWRSGARPCPRSMYELLRLTLDERWRIYRAQTGAFHLVKFFGGNGRLNASIGLRFGLPANDEVDIFRFPASDEM